MIARLDEGGLAAAVARVQQMAPNRRTFDERWLSRVSGKVVAGAGGLQLDPTDLTVLVDAAGRAGATGMLVVDCEPGSPAQEALTVGLSIAELSQVQEDEFLARGHIVMPVGAELPAVLLDWYHGHRLYAGTEDYLRQMYDDLHEARADFCDGIEGARADECADLHAVARLMDWIDDLKP